MDVQVRRHSCIDLVEELAKLDGAVALVAFSDHLAGLHVQGGEERGCAVPDIVVRTALDLAGPHRQQWLRAVERLYLRLLINAEHERLLRRVHVEAHDVAYLLYEQRVAGELEGSAAVGLPDDWREQKGKRPPDPVDGAPAQS